MSEAVTDRILKRHSFVNLCADVDREGGLYTALHIEYSCQFKVTDWAWSTVTSLSALVIQPQGPLKLNNMTSMDLNFLRSIR